MKIVCQHGFGAGRTRARHVERDVWEIEGVKRLITNGDFDVADNIVHLVLARPEGHWPGTKGLSMFIVPKFWVNEDGSLGERNGVYCTNIEHKMGLKASATCEMTFGEKRPARGLLLGEVHDGIRQMFDVIEHARMAVGCKSMATLSTAYLNALEFTKIRDQGPDLLKANDKAAPRVRIIQHPDVRRMLMLQKSFAEGMRALCLFTASIQDEVTLAGGHGSVARPSFVENHDLPILDVSVEFSAGSSMDTADNSGLANLVRHLLNLGTKDLSEDQIATALADICAQLGGNFDRDRAGVTLRTLSNERERIPASKVLASIIQFPQFPQDVLTREISKNCREH